MSVAVGRRALRTAAQFGFAAAIGLLTAGAAPAAAGSDAKCSEAKFPVQLAATQRTLRGTLCRPAGDLVPRAAIVLVHGATYDRAYWDPALDPGRYSALRILAKAGYLTLAIDRLGSGASDRPPVTEATPDVAASAFHEVIARLGTDPGMRTSSGQVVVIGHSAGSVAALREAAQYSDVDALVITGLIHSAGPGAGFFGAMIHPAASDPSFAGDPSVPAGYVTTRPGTRISFYYPFTAAERVVQLDERTKDAMPGGDPSFVTERDSGAFAREVDVPVLVVVGTHDLGFCTPTGCPEAATEATFYPTAASFDLITRPRTGHDLNLHLNARETTAGIRRWVDRHTGLFPGPLAGSWRASPFGA